MREREGMRYENDGWSRAPVLLGTVASWSHSIPCVSPFFLCLFYVPKCLPLFLLLPWLSPPLIHPPHVLSSLSSSVMHSLFSAAAKWQKTPHNIGEETAGPSLGYCNLSPQRRGLALRPLVSDVDKQRSSTGLIRVRSFSRRDAAILPHDQCCLYKSSSSGQLWVDACCCQQEHCYCRREIMAFSNLGWAQCKCASTGCTWQRPYRLKCCTIKLSQIVWVFVWTWSHIVMYVFSIGIEFIRASLLMLQMWSYQAAGSH